MKHYLELPDIAESLASGHAMEGIVIPPRATRELGGRIVEYRKNESMVAVYPVEERFTNPMGMLQGGILTAMLDDIFGWLTYAATARPVVSTGLNVQFIRGVKPGSGLIIRATIVSRSRRTLLVTAEAHNEKGRLVAIMQSHGMILFEPAIGPAHRTITQPGLDKTGKNEENQDIVQ